jgi:hypothetical protein
MTPEKDKELCLKYPDLFVLRQAGEGNPTIKSYAIAWGFECDDGWFSIIDNLSNKIQKIIQTLPEEDRQHYYVVQCKEKFGTLRYYMSGETKEMTEAIQEAEDLSVTTCEFCGKAGKLDCSQHWIKTLCPDCSELRNKNKKG